MKSTEQNLSFQLKLVEDTFSQIQQLVHSQMKGAALKMAKSLFDEEVERLCGKRFSRKGDNYFLRAGNDPGSILVNGQKVKIKKPRVKNENGEVRLQTYQALNDYDLLCDKIMNYMLSGVSTRNYEPLLDEISEGTGLKKSSVSKAFIKGSREHLNLINGRDLRDFDIFSIMIDGVHIGGRTVIVALGIDSSGKKHIIGIREGNTENSIVVKDLLSSLIERGLSKENPILFIIDGSKALRKAISSCFSPQALVQRCTIHKGRNVCEYLPKNNHSEFYRKWKRINSMTNYSDALKEYKSLLLWIESINYQAATSLKEADNETLTVIKLGIPLLLRKTLHSTNPIETVFSQAKPNISRVKNWTGTDQISRWVASTSIRIEEKFRTIKGYKQIPLLKENMKTLYLASKDNV